MASHMKRMYSEAAKIESGESTTVYMVTESELIFK